MSTAIHGNSLLVPGTTTFVANAICTPRHGRIGPRWRTAPPEFWMRNTRSTVCVFSNVPKSCSVGSQTGRGAARQAHQERNTARITVHVIALAGIIQRRDIYSQSHSHASITSLLPICQSLAYNVPDTRFEPRTRWPPGSRCAGTQAALREQAAVRFTLVVTDHARQPHLPKVELRAA